MNTIIEHTFKKLEEIPCGTIFRLVKRDELFIKTDETGSWDTILCVEIQTGIVHYFDDLAQVITYDSEIHIK